MNRIFLIAAVMLPLAACTTVDDPFLKTGALKADGPALATSVSPDYALAILPGLSTTSVRQTVGDSHIEQTILFANATNLAGENALTITVGKTGKSFRTAPSQSEIETEMRNLFSGVRMRVSNIIADNAYGVFGYATGALGKSGSCVYAWQHAKSIAPNGGGSGYAALIRLRYCNPSMEQDRIALLMQGLRLKPVSSETFRTLRFAAGAENASQAPLYAAQPLMVSETHEATTMTPVRRTPRRAAVDETSSEPAKADDKTVGNAVRVPMPGEAAVLAKNDSVSAVDEKAEAGKVIVKPSLVPLPDKVAATAR